MQNASSVDAHENGNGAMRAPASVLWQLLTTVEGLRLTSIYPRGAAVFSQGEAAEGVYLLRSGRAKVSLSSAEGKTIILRVAGPGALLGVNSVLKRVPYDVTVETLERSRIDFVSRADFERVIEKSEAVRPSLAQFLADELSDMIDCVRSLLLCQSAAEKFAALLLRLSNGTGTTTSGTRLNLGLTHEEIAQMICSSRETVTRLFAEFKRRQIVTLSNNTIVVSDRRALESLAGVTTTSSR
ncbi:MAG TPA: Crp/Fnr family transcriptional regulator [Pyrinomonadaceae bacterium]|nr:Crp/Fnr family transcriptional regulator [Pyrinomonadaceae bacterium]